MIYYIEISGNTFYTNKVWFDPPKSGFHCYCYAAATASHPILEYCFGPNPAAPV